MARFFGRNKNQAEIDFRRFEREIYIQSTQKPSPYPPQHEEEVYSQDYDNPNFSPRLSPSGYQQENSEPLRSPRGERQTFSHEQPRLRPTPEFRSTESQPSQEGPYQRLTSSPNYRTHDYRQASRQDELKGLGFWQDEEESSDEGSEEWVERPSPFKFIIALLGLTLMVSIIWFGYRWLSQPTLDGPPLIQAEPGPFKVKPENPGGASIPYQDKLIYGRISPEAGAPVERLLPPHEQPEPSTVQQQGYNQTAPYPQTAQTYPPQPHYTQTAPAYQPSPGTALPPPPPSYQNAGEQPVYPSPQATYPSYQPHQNTTAPGSPYPAYPSPHDPPAPVNSAPAPVQPSIPYPPPNGTTYPPQPHTNPYQSLPNQPPSSSERGSAEKEEIQEQAAVTPQPKTATKPHFYCQVGTLPTENGAQQELGRLRRRYDREINSSEGTVRAFKSPEGKKIYRVLLGPFKSRNIALSKCSKLGSSCRVVPLS